MHPAAIGGSGGSLQEDAVGVKAAVLGLKSSAALVIDPPVG